MSPDEFVDVIGGEIVIADSVPVDALLEEKSSVPISVTVNDVFVEVVYETPAPEIVSEEKTKVGKRIFVTSPEDVVYTDVLIYSDWLAEWGTFDISKV